MDVIYHQLQQEDVLKKLETSEAGLSNEEVTKRQQKFGKNNIPQPKSKTLLQIFFRQFLNPLIYVLIAAAIISGFSKDLEDAIFITAIIVINAILGTYQERRAENSAAALQKLVKVKCRVRRGNRIFEIDFSTGVCLHTPAEVFYILAEEFHS